MYILPINIKSDDLEFLRRLQDDLRMIFSESNADIDYTFGHIEQEQRGVAAPPPEERRPDINEYQSMTREQWDAYRERYAMMEEMRMVKEELEEIKHEMPELFRKDKDFIEEEEMKL